MTNSGPPLLFSAAECAESVLPKVDPWAQDFGPMREKAGSSCPLRCLGGVQPSAKFLARGPERAIWAHLTLALF